MNFIVGKVSNDHGKVKCGLPVERLSRTFDADLQLLDTGIESLSCGVLSDKGKIIGMAGDSEATLVFIGHFLNSGPLKSNNSSPLDDPDATAGRLLKRYHEFGGARFLDDIIGYYALWVFDKSEQAVFLARDPFGLRRLFYYQSDNKLVFSSKLASVGLVLGDELEIDRSLEDFLLSYDFLPWGRTPYKNVKSLEKGTMLEWRDGKIKRHIIKCDNIWNNRLSGIDLNNCSEENLIEHLYDAFMTALEEQLPTRGKIGVLLGGLDSALVASALKRLGRDVETFSFRFEKPYYNQKHTDTLASFAGIKHNWIPVSKEVIKKGLLNFSLIFNQTASQAHYPIQTAFTCAAMRKKGIQYCLTGDGCDGVFMGYPNVYRRARLFANLDNVPSFLPGLLIKASQPYIFEKYLGHLYRVGRNYLNILRRKRPTRGHIAYRVYDELTLSRLRRRPAPPQEKPTEVILEELSAGLEHLTPARLAYHGKSYPGLNTTKIEGSADFSGMIIDSPFLHPGLANFAKRLPDQSLRPEKTDIPLSAGKYILVKMVQEKGLLPEEIIYQEKRSPVGAPIDSWYENDLYPFVKQLLQDLPFEYNEKYVNDLLRPKTAEQFFRKFFTVDHIASQAIGILLAYASFAKIGSQQ